MEPAVLASERPQTHFLDRSATCIKWIAEFNETKPLAHPENGDGFFPETSENLHMLTRLSSRENLIEFCRRESFKTYIIAEVQENNPQI